jgi:hypothetical protein
MEGASREAQQVLQPSAAMYLRDSVRESDAAMIHAPKFLRDSNDEQFKFLTRDTGANDSMRRTIKRYRLLTSFNVRFVMPPRHNSPSFESAVSRR